MKLTPRLTKVGLAGAGLVAGVIVAGTLGAQAATPTPTPTTSTSTATSPADPHPGDHGADGVPESAEVHGGHGCHGGPSAHGGALRMSGTVTAVGASTVTIKTATATTVYTVTSSTDVDKNGESSLSALAVGDAVTFSVERANAKQIDKLHAGSEALDRPAGSMPPPAAPSSGA